MNSTRPALAPASSLLPHTLRVVGALLVLVSAFFLVKNLGFGVIDDAFCTLTLGLGIMTFSAGWLPEPDTHTGAVLEAA